MKEIFHLPAHKISKLLHKREISVEGLVKSVLERIEEKEKEIRAFITIEREKILEEARELDKRFSKREELPRWAGIPIAIKDNICTQGMLTTCGSKILSNFYPPYDATVIRKIKKEGLLIIGKTNMDEFAMGSSTENSYFGPTHNPWDLRRVPGGSSGGSAAAVISGETILSLGSDTGGSIRQPASFCGVVGLKPTYGSVSRYGLVAFASSLDQIGPITKDVLDAYFLFHIIKGRDSQDSTSLPQTSLEENLKGEVKGTKIGLPKEYFTPGVDKEVKRWVEESFKVFQTLGAELIEISLPHTEFAVAAYYIIAPSEASSNLARYDGVHYGYRTVSPREKGEENPVVEMYEKTRQEGFGEEVKRRIMLGTYALSAGYFEAYYLKAQKVRTLIKRDFEEAFQTCEVILTPVSPTPPFLIGEKIKDPLKMYLSDIFTIPVNLAGLPAVSIPCGFTEEGLPIGLQLIGRPLEEVKLLQVAFAFQEATDFHKRRPL